MIVGSCVTTCTAIPDVSLLPAPPVVLADEITAAFRILVAVEDEIAAYATKWACDPAPYVEGSGRALEWRPLWNRREACQVEILRLARRVVA